MNSGFRSGEDDMAFGHNTTAATEMDETEFIVWPPNGFLRTTKEQIDIAQLHFLSLLHTTRLFS